MCHFKLATRIYINIYWEKFIMWSAASLKCIFSIGKWNNGYLKCACMRTQNVALSAYQLNESHIYTFVCIYISYLSVCLSLTLASLKFEQSEKVSSIQHLRCNVVYQKVMVVLQVGGCTRMFTWPLRWFQKIACHFNNECLFFMVLLILVYVEQEYWSLL